MPAPTEATFSVDSLVAAHEALRDLIDAGSSAGSVKIRSAGDVLLAELPLDDPCGTVSGTTGQLTFAFDGDDDSPAADGTAAYGEFCDSDDNVHLSLPVAEGTVAVDGYLVLNSLSILSAASVSAISATVG